MLLPFRIQSFGYLVMSAIHPLNMSLQMSAAPCGHITLPSTLTCQTWYAPLYYLCNYASLSHNQVVAFLYDYQNALSRADVLDDQIEQDSEKASLGGKYWALASLAARQTFGALDITAPQQDGSTRLFMRDIGFSRLALSAASHVSSLNSQVAG